MSLFHCRFGGSNGERVRVPTPILALVGVVVFYLGGFQLFDSYLLSSRGVVTTGEVVGKNYSTRRGHRHVSSLNIRFQTPNGRQIEFRGNPMNGWSSSSRGDVVSVIYDPQHPARANLNDPLCLWLSPGMFTGMGLVLLAFCGLRPS